MGNFVRRHWAHVTGWVAVVTLVTTLGVAEALPGQNTVTSDDIVNGQVKSVDIGNGQVRTPDLRRNAVTSAKIKNGAVGAADIKDGSVGSAELGCNDGAIKGAVRIDAENNIPNTPTLGTTGVTQAYNCTGGAVQVTQISTGWFRVVFGGLNDARPMATASEFFDSCNQATINVVPRNGGYEVFTVEQQGAEAPTARNCDFYLTLT